MATAPFEVGLWISVLPLLLAAATLTWLISLPIRNVGIADVLWSLLLFMAGVVYALGSDPRAPRLSLVLWLLALWAARLAWHLTGRNLAAELPRYRDLRERHGKGFWIIALFRFFWVRVACAWVVSLPLLGACASNEPIGWLDHAGVAVWALGFTVEVIADRQLARFRRDPANADRVLDRGLWRYSRHPNYLGELGVWTGFWLIALGAGAGWSVAGPLLLAVMLGWLTGVAPMERDIGNRRPPYADYVLKTNAFLPGPPRN